MKGSIFGGVVEVVGLFVVVVLIMAIWTQWSRQKALAQAELVKQTTYSDLEWNAGNAIISSIFNR